MQCNVTEMPFHPNPIQNIERGETGDQPEQKIISIKTFEFEFRYTIQY